MVAQVFPVYAAIGTDTAGVAEPRDADALAHCQPFYAGSDRIDPADDLVTGSGSSPSTTCKSVRQTPHAVTLTRICPGPAADQAVPSIRGES